MRALHLFDHTADWEQRIAVNQLLDRLAPHRLTQSLASTDPRVPPDRWLSRTRITRLPIRFNLPFTAAARLRRLIRRERIDVIHAWGPDAAVAAAAAIAADTAAPPISLVVQRFDPHLHRAEAAAFRTLARSPRFAVACAAGTVRRRLIENGVPDSVCVVIRPAVDFRRIGVVKKHRTIRSQLGLAPDHHVTVTAYPVTRHTGHDRALWGGLLRRYLNPAHRMIIHGHSPQCRRLRRLSQSFPVPDAVTWTAPDVRYEDIIAAADCLVIAPNRDVSTTPIAWAMAAAVPVVGSAVHAVAELIAHKHNGLLIKPDKSPAMALKIANAINRSDALAREKEVARGQAFEVFGITRFVDQNLRLYENLAAGAPPAQDITDAAFDG